MIDIGFYEKCVRFNDFEPGTVLGRFDRRDVEQALKKRILTDSDFLALLSPAAEPFIEEMAQKAHGVTVRQFGRVIKLYTPIYLSNYCTNQCVYCGFSDMNRISRKQLTLEEVETETGAIAKTGLKQILILTGDARKIATLGYIKDCVRIIVKYFTSVGIEIYALDQEEYTELIEAGVDYLTIYQETYNIRLYGRLHRKGPKKDFRYRLEAPDRACKAGIRAVNIGALMGLDDWRREAYLKGLHAKYLQRRFPGVELGISLPRITPHAGRFHPDNIVDDKSFVQGMLALRLFLPSVGLTISTREPADLRDNLIRLGVTKMSAGSSTKVGGWTTGNQDTGQFDIFDHRTVDEIKQQISRFGYQPVFKDWQPI